MLPLQVKRIEHCQARRSAGAPDSRAQSIRILWSISGRCILTINGNSAGIKPGSCALILRNSKLTLSVIDRWEFTVLELDGVDADAIVKGFRLTDGVTPISWSPADLLTEIEHASAEPSAAGRHKAGVLAFRMLSDISLAAHHKPAPHRSPQEQAAAPGSTRPPEARPEAAEPADTGLPAAIVRAIDIMDAEYARTDLSIERIAELVTTHRSTLTKQFRAALGMSPIEYMTVKRIKSALTLLRTSQLPVSEIARQCGYSNPNYFCRLIKRFTSYSPIQIRSGRARQIEYPSITRNTERQDPDRKAGPVTPLQSGRPSLSAAPRQTPHSGRNHLEKEQQS